MVMLMMLQGELPGRPEGEKVVSCDISHGWRSLCFGRVTETAVAMWPILKKGRTAAERILGTDVPIGKHRLDV